MKKARLALMVLLGALAGCAHERLPYPKAVVGPGLEQLKLQSAAHWNLLASNETEQIFQVLPNYSTFYVSANPDTGIPFLDAYHEMLISHLVKGGAEVVLNADDALYQVEYEIQTVKHRRKEQQRLQPGTATAFVAVGELLDEASHWGQRELVLIPVAVGVDLWNAFWPNTSEETTEVIINTRLHDGRRIVAADSRVYYFNARDLHNYSQGRSFPVIGKVER